MEWLRIGLNNIFELDITELRKRNNGLKQKTFKMTRNIQKSKSDHFRQLSLGNFTGKYLSKPYMQIIAATVKENFS